MPIAKQATQCILLAIAGHENMTIKHYDIPAAFLHGDLSHEVHRKQPPGYQSENKSLICKLKKNLCGLKQGANEWNKKLIY